MIFLCFLFSNSQGKVHKSKSIDLDLMLFGGYNSSELFSDIRNVNILESKWKHHFHVGVALRLELGKWFYIQPEAYITRKGGILNVMRSSDTINQNIDYQAIDVPFLVGGKIFSTEDFNFRIYAGPVVSFISNKTLEVLRGQAPIANVKDYANILSAQAGIGFDFFFITLDFRYEIGTTRLLSVPDFMTRNNVLYISLGFKFL
jgi:hypothetical protein